MAASESGIGDGCGLVDHVLLEEIADPADNTVLAKRRSPRLSEPSDGVSAGRVERTVIQTSATTSSGSTEAAQRRRDALVRLAQEQRREARDEPRDALAVVRDRLPHVDRGEMVTGDRLPACLVHLETGSGMRFATLQSHARRGRNRVDSRGLRRAFSATSRGARRKPSRNTTSFYPGFEDVIASEWQPAPGRDRAAPGALAARARVDDRDATLDGGFGAARWTLGKYRIERELGRGAQGTVFLARDESLDRRVALKVLKPAWTGSDAMVRRFELEAQALARMDPRGLAIVHDAGVVHGLRFLAMRYVEGQTLAQRARRPRRSHRRRGDPPVRRARGEGGPRAPRRARGRPRSPRRQTREPHDHARGRARPPRLRARAVLRERRALRSR